MSKKEYTLSEEDLIALNQISSLLENLRVNGAENIFVLAAIMKMLQGVFERVNGAVGDGGKLPNNSMENKE